MTRVAGAGSSRGPAVGPRRGSRAASGIALLAALAAGGCGYSTGSMLPAGARSIAVSVAENDTFYRQDELAYTRHLTRELVRRAHVRVRDARDADALLETRIERLSRLPLVEGERDATLEEGLIGRVEVTLRDKATGTVLDRFEVRRRSESIFPRGEDLDFSRAELARELAEDTVVALERRSFLVEKGYVATETRKVTMIEEPR